MRVVFFTLAAAGVLLTEAACAKTVLFVRSGSTYTSSEQLRVTDFQSWGYAVTPIEDGDTQTNYDAAFASADVVYVPATVVSPDVSYKLREATIGIVCEEGQLADELGVATSVTLDTGTTVSISDNTHSATAHKTTGSITFASSTYEARKLTGTVASGAQTLATWNSTTWMVAVEEGATLVNTYNSSSTAFGRRVLMPITDNVSWSNLSSDGKMLFRRAIDWAATPLQSAGDLLFVRQGGTYTDQERVRVAQFETWGYTVTPITESDSQANYDAAVASVDVVYVSEEVNSSNVSYKLREATVGVINEEVGLTDEFGFSTAHSTVSSQTTLNVIDNTHEITSVFSTGNLTFASPAVSVYGVGATVASGGDILAQWGSDGAIMAVETGATLVNTYNGSDSAFGRRVFFPATNTFEWTYLAADGLELLERALDWAASTGTTSDLVGHWKLDETSGTTAADSSGSGNDGTYQNSPTLGVGAVYGDGVEFDGTSQYVEVTGLNLTESVSVSCWSKSDSSTWNSNGFLVCKRDQFILHPYGGSSLAWYFYRDGEGWNSATTVDTGDIEGFSLLDWHHYAATYDSATGTGRLYIDGALVDESTLGAGNLNSDSSSLFIGRDDLDSSRYFGGQMDEVRLYSRALSAEEVAELYGLIGHWKLTETSGATAADSSNVDNDGAYTNSPTLAQEEPYPGHGETADFDGTNDHVDLGTQDADFTQGVTIAAWAKPTAVKYSARFVELGNGQQTDNIFFARYLDEDGLNLGLRDGSLGASNDLIADDEVELDRWQHFAATIDASGEATIYKNGQAVKTGTIGTPLEVSRAQCYIARSTWSSDEYYEGGLADVRVYNRALSASQVAELHGLVGHWTFDEGSGSTAADSSSYGADLAATGTAAWTTSGVRSNAMSFDGTNEMRADARVHARAFTGDAISIAGWFKLDTAVADLTIASHVAGFNASSPVTGASIFLNANTDSFRFRIYDEYEYYNWFDITPFVAGVGVWRHAAAVYDGAEVRWYIDGEEVVSFSMPWGLAPPMSYFRIGKDFPGDIDDVVIYNRAMSEEEIAEHYGLVGHWKLDETTGSVAYDSTAFANHGALLGAAAWTTSGGKQAVDFDGSTSYISLGNPDHLNFSQDITMSAWVRHHVTPSSGVIYDILSHGYQTSPSNAETVLRLSGGPYYQASSWGLGPTVSTSIPAGDVNTWVHILGHYQSDRWRIYRNGVLESTTVHAEGADLVDNADWAIGATGDGSERHFDGDLRDVRIYNRAVTDDEIEDIYNGGKIWGLKIIQWVEAR